MKISDEDKRRALAAVNDPVFETAHAYLHDRAVQSLLSAKTPEEREEAWQHQKAIKDLTKLIKRWAEEARNKDRKG